MSTSNLKDSKDFKGNKLSALLLFAFMIYFLCGSLMAQTTNTKTQTGYQSKSNVSEPMLLSQNNNSQKDAEQKKKDEQAQQPTQKKKGRVQTQKTQVEKNTKVNAPQDQGAANQKSNVQQNTNNRRSANQQNINNQKSATQQGNINKRSAAQQAVNNRKSAVQQSNQNQKQQVKQNTPNRNQQAQQGNQNQKPQVRQNTPNRNQQAQQGNQNQKPQVRQNTPNRNQQVQQGNQNRNTQVEQKNQNRTPQVQQGNVSQNNGRHKPIVRNVFHAPNQGTSYTYRRFNHQGPAPVATGHYEGSNRAPRGSVSNWNGYHWDNNHTYVTRGGYFHDQHQGQFYERRNRWHHQYPFMTFRLRFFADPFFPYNDLYYYPTDYVVVGSRLSVLVLPLTYTDDPYSYADDITDNFVSSMSDLRRFKVIGRSSLNRILINNNIDEADLIDPNVAKRVGRLAGADMVVMGTIDDAQNQVTLSVRGYDPFTGQTIVRESATSDYTDNQSIDGLTKYVSVQIYNDLPLSEGQITHLNSNQVYLNFGRNQGIDIGTRCVVYRETRRGTIKIGEVYVVATNNNGSRARIISGTGSGRMRIGDNVIVK